MMEDTKILEKHIVGENGIGYMLGSDGLYYPDLELSEGHALQHREVWASAVGISENPP